MTIAIAIQSCINYKDRRDAIRNTWMKDIPSDVFSCFFVGSHCDEPNVESLNCGDSYKDCGIKQFEMIKFLKDYDHVFFCDDDTYVVVDRLLNSEYENDDYIGCPCNIENSHVIMAHGGAGFWMSKKAMNQALEIGINHNQFHNNIFSDRTVAYLMDMAGIKLKGDYRYNLGKYNGNKGFCNLVPNKNNKYITTHFVVPYMFKMIDYHFKHGHPLPINNYSVNFGRNIIVLENKDGTWKYKINGDDSFIGNFNMANEAELAAMYKLGFRN